MTSLIDIIAFKRYPDSLITNAFNLLVQNGLDLSY